MSTQPPNINSSEPLKPVNRKLRKKRRKTSSPSQQLNAILQYFPIFTSNHGCGFLAHFVHRQMISRCPRLTMHVSELQLSYITTLAFFNRLVQCGLYYGIGLPADAFRLNNLTKLLQLPTILADYVETIGMVTFGHGARVVPHVDSGTHMFSGQAEELFLTPQNILREAGREIPLYAWAIDVAWIQDYSLKIQLASSDGFVIRTVDNSTFLGNKSLLVSYREERGLLLPLTPDQMSVSEAHRGAVYRFRNESLRELWSPRSAILHNVFTSKVVDPNIFLTELGRCAFERHNSTLSN